MKNSFTIKNCDLSPEDYAPVHRGFLQKQKLPNEIWVFILPYDLTIDMWNNIGKEKCYKQHWKNPTKILTHNLQFCKMEVFPHVCVFKSKTSPSISLNSGLIFLNNWPTQTATFNVTTDEFFNCHASNIPEIRLLEF